MDCGVKPSQLRKYQNPQIKFKLPLTIYLREVPPQKITPRLYYHCFCRENLEIRAPNSFNPQFVEQENSPFKSSLDPFITHHQWALGFCVLDPQGTSRQHQRQVSLPKKVRQSTSQKMDRTAVEFCDPTAYGL